MTVLGLLMGLVVPKAEEFVYRARVTKAIGDINAIQVDIDGFAAGTDSLPTSLAEIGRDAMLDPWDNPYVYNNFSLSNGNGVPQGARRDRFLVPINSTYDLFSMGRDGRSVPALTAGASKDDIVRANDGGFIGLGNLY
jgi:general secretion pathway protein G